MIKTKSTTIEFESGLKVEIYEDGQLYFHSEFIKPEQTQEFFEDINALKELIEKK